MGEIGLYNEKDKRCAAVRLRRCVFLLGCMLLPLAAVYALGVIKSLRLVMLAALLAGFACAVFYCDFYLLPALRYLSFLQGLENGLRRSLDCSLECISKETERQDGAFVHMVQVRCLENAETRIFYVNTSKCDLLPQEGTRLRLTSCGRHIVSFKLY